MIEKCNISNAGRAAGGRPAATLDFVSETAGLPAIAMSVADSAMRAVSPGAAHNSVDV
jgi:hypothetical protein